MSKIITLSQLNPPLPAVDLGAAGVHQVCHATGFVMELLNAAREASGETKLWEAAALLVPSATRDAIFGLSIVQVEAILAIATAPQAVAAE